MSKKLSEQRNLKRRIEGVTMPIKRKRTKWGRNWLCLCGSGKKYKVCCLGDINDLTMYDGNAKVSELSEDIQKLIEAHRKVSNKGGTYKNEQSQNCISYRHNRTRR